MAKKKGNNAKTQLWISENECSEVKVLYDQQLMQTNAINESELQKAKMFLTFLQFFFVEINI